MDTTADDIETLHATIVVECLAPPHDPHQRTTVRPVTTCPGCGNPVSRLSVACGGCYATVPRALARQLNMSDPCIDAVEHVNARNAVVAWLRRTRRVTATISSDVLQAEQRLDALRQHEASLRQDEEQA